MKIEYLITKEIDQFCESKEAFLSLLKTNSHFVVKRGVLMLDSLRINFAFKTEKINDDKERLFFITFECKNTTQKIEAETLSKMRREFHKTLKSSGWKFKINNLWDEVSQYYCHISYPKISIIENLLRKLILHFMTIKVGSDWFHKATPDDLKKKFRANSMKVNIMDLCENNLYETDFIQLAEFLFLPYSIMQSSEDLFLKLEGVKELSDLEEIKKLKPRSNWERYFAGVIDFKDLNEKWSKLYEFRNKVAHNKIILKSDVDKIAPVIDYTREKLIEATDSLNKVRVSENDKQVLSKIATHTFESHSLVLRPSLVGDYSQGLYDNSAMSAIRPSMLSTSMINSASDHYIFAAKTCSVCKRPLPYFSKDEYCDFCKPSLSVSSIAYPFSEHNYFIQSPGSGNFGFNNNCLRCGQKLILGESNLCNKCFGI